MTGGAARLDVSGFWCGRYAYPSDAVPPVAFFANLSETAGGEAAGISGTISEPGPPDGSSDRLHSVVDGVREGRRVRFRKQYDGAGDYAHAVHYHGQLSADGLEISGRWSIDGWGGAFTMSRPAADAAEEENRVGIAVPPEPVSAG